MAVTEDKDLRGDICDSEFVEEVTRILPASFLSLNWTNPKVSIVGPINNRSNNYVITR